MKFLITALLIAASITPANAYVFGGSNLGFSGYPTPTCTKPYKPYAFSSEWEAERYISDRRQYIDCVNEYIEAANNDIKRIKEAAQDAIDEAESNY